MVKFGAPELFSKDHLLRLEQLHLANSRFQKIEKERRNAVKDKIDEHTVLFVKGYGTDAELISCFRELLFNSRELLDSLLFYIHKASGNKTPKSFLPFAKALMNGQYDNIGLEIIPFLKQNFTYVFHIRKFRNEMKNKISNIEYLLITKKIFARFQLPISPDEKELVAFLEINNKDNALNSNYYYTQINLSEYFPEISEFWKVVFSIMK